MTRKKRKVIAISLLTALLLGVILSVFFLHDQDGASNLQKFDLIGGLQKIDQHNAALDQTNQTIVSSMGKLDQQVGKTGEVSDQLTAVNGGLSSQYKTLQALNPVTADQVTLSTNLRKLSVQLKAGMNQISTTSSKQSKELANMSETLTRTGQQMGQVVKGNEEINQELLKAKKVSQQVEESIP